MRLDPHSTLLGMMLRGQSDNGMDKQSPRRQPLPLSDPSIVDSTITGNDLLPTAAPTSQYLDSSKEVVAWISITGIIITMGWIVRYFLKRVRYPSKVSARVRRKDDVQLEGRELHLHHTLASYEEVKANPTHYYMMDLSGKTSIMTPLESNAYVSPYRAYVKIPAGLIGNT